MRVSIVVPKLTRRQKAGTTALCSAATALFIVPSAVVPWADVSALTATAGLVIPAGVAALFWTTKGAADENDRQTSVEAAQARAAARAEMERQQAARRRPSPRPPGEVIEGQVVR